MWPPCIKKIEHLVGHLVGNDVDNLHEDGIHLVGFSFIRVLGGFSTRCRGYEGGI